jgi:hypothetical protein
LIKGGQTSLRFHRSTLHCFALAKSRTLDHLAPLRSRHFVVSFTLHTGLNTVIPLKRPLLIRENRTVCVIRTILQQVDRSVCIAPQESPSLG